SERKKESMRSSRRYVSTFETDAKPHLTLYKGESEGEIRCEGKTRGNGEKMKGEQGLCRETEEVRVRESRLLNVKGFKKNASGISCRFYNQVSLQVCGLIVIGKEADGESESVRV